MIPFKESLLALVLATALLLPVDAQAGLLSIEGEFNQLDANEVKLVTFALTSTADLHIQSWGYGGTGMAAGGTNGGGRVVAAGGFDSYLTLFVGSGDKATLIAANDDGDCPLGNPDPACHDATLKLTALPAGRYTLAISVFGNVSFAENTGGGTLGDGFIGLASYYDAASASERSSAYAVDIDSAALAVAEPATGALVGLAGAALAALRRRARPAPR